MLARIITPSTLSATKADQNSEGARAFVSAPLLAVPEIVYVVMVSVNTWLLRDDSLPPDTFLKKRFDSLLDLGPYGKLRESRFITGRTALELVYVAVVKVDTRLLRDDALPPDIFLKKRFDSLLDLGPYGKLLESRFLPETTEAEECDSSLETLLSAQDSLASSVP